MKKYDDKSRPKPKPRPPEYRLNKPTGASPRPSLSSGSAPPAQKTFRPAAQSVTHWDDVAEWYNDLVGEGGSEYHRQVVLPGVTRLLQPIAGRRLLDVACGQGVLCRLLHKHGAKVVGVDAAAKLIESAKPLSDPAIQYHVGDARKLSEVPGLAAEPFDAATSVLAVQNIDPIAPMFEGVSSLLRPGGAFVIVMMHPAFRSPKATSWGFEGHGVQFRRVDRYLVPRKEAIVCHPGKPESRSTWTFHRPLQTYVQELTRVGLLVEAVEEWASHKISQPGPRAYAENFARREIPMFLTLRAVKR